MRYAHWHMAWPQGTIRGVFWYWSWIRVRKSGLRPYFLDKQGPATSPALRLGFIWNERSTDEIYWRVGSLWVIFDFQFCLFWVQRVTAGRIGMECLILSWVIWLTFLFNIYAFKIWSILQECKYERKITDFDIREWISVPQFRLLAVLSLKEVYWKLYCLSS